MVKVKLLLVCISLMSLYEISDVLNFKAGDKLCRFNKALLNGAWGVPEEENALFFIEEDSVFYVEHFENGYPVQLNECMLNIFYKDYTFKGHLLKLSSDSLVYQAEDKIIRLYRRGEDFKENETCDLKDLMLIEHQELDIESVKKFLLALAGLCRNNVEFIEVANEVLFQVLDKVPGKVVTLIEEEKDIDEEEVYYMLQSPIHDGFDLENMIQKLKDLPQQSKVKSRVIESLEIALAKY